MKYNIIVKGHFNVKTEGKQVTFRTVFEEDLKNEYRVLNKMLENNEISSYEVSLDRSESIECTCFTCDPECEVLPCIN